MKICWQLLKTFFFLILLKLRTKSMLSSHQRGSRYGKEQARLNSSIRWKENNNVKRVDSVKVSILSNLCKAFFMFFPSFCLVIFFYGLQSTCSARSFVLRKPYVYRESYVNEALMMFRWFHVVQYKKKA